MTTTHCPYCALQCAMHLETGPDGRLTARPAPFSTNRGGLCRKGWTSPALLTSPDRLTRPLLRTDRSAPLKETDWDTALDHITQRLLHLRAQHGPDTAAVFGSGALTNEKAYMLGKFARLALGTSQIDYNGRFCMSSAAAAANTAFGLDRGIPFPLADIGSARTVLLAGANPAETMPPMMGHLSAPTLIVVDPRRSATARAALDRGGLHLAPRPGTDLALARGLLHAVHVRGHTDRDYIDERTTGFEAAWEHAATWWPEHTEHVTGVPAAQLHEAADLLGQAARRRSAYILTGRGTEQHTTGTDTVSAWINLALALGLPGREGSGYGCITGQGNGQGGREHGQKADQLPGYRHITDPDDRAHIARTWGVDPADLPGPGRSAYELLDSLGRSGGPRALLLFGSNPVVSAPHSSRVRSRLRSLDLLVSADFVLSETAAMADVVLPVAQWAEESGTTTNLEGRVLRRDRATAPPPGVRTDLEVLHHLAVRLGQPGTRFPTDPDTALAELGRASAGARADYSGVTPQNLASGQALHWPVRADGRPTPRLFLNRFAHPGGRARFASPAHRPPAEATDTRFPLIATTGRLMGHYQTGAQTRRIPELADAEPEAYVEVHPDTAARAGLSAGDWALVTSRRGTVRARIRTDPTARPDTLFLPFHYAGAQAANNLTHPALDPTSRMPEFKVSAVRLRPAHDPGDPS
ncbi:molybdopterin oxidoreductase family protein [Nocardiopsis algeriensis]|uniref:Assimilatory nitrate reductase catalytic subunit n=1 Tax=Nocardiopsis algeriensis TaxID=1478215 RepID=A0A841IPB2_9ACTN|nr:molybdopterin oxidoreductase family protein [Nocardiopsis algeriensis]MBB6119922.1 assimilatory nitrate reductase catalytic subunit [Nocardiopsis algeriensis]